MNYFDYAATCPLDSEAAQVYVKAASEIYGNSQSLHDTGGQASDLLENCRSEFAKLLGVAKEGIFFTSGGSESNFLGINSLLSSAAKNGKHIITGIAEHSSIHSTLETLKEKHYEITALPLSKTGHIDVGQLQSAVRDDTVLISIQHANPEIGTLQPLQEISDICKKHNILFHSDCVQTFGKTDILQTAQLVDSLSISSHKFYGPKGVGAVYIHPRLNWKSFYPGSSHEKGLRPGTVNVPGIAAMTAAAQKAYSYLEAHTAHYNKLREILISALAPIKPSYTIFGSAGPGQMPSTIGLALKGLEGQFVMLECNRYGFAISTGSACHIGLQSPSRTMEAMGITGKNGKEFIRISFGRETTDIEAKELGETIVKIVKGIPQTY